MKSKGIVYWLAEKQKRPVVQFFALVMFVSLFYLILGSIEATIAFTLGMFVHELGHYFIFVKNRILTIIRIIFPLGAAAMPANDENEKLSDLLPWWNISTLLQAGYTMNIALMLVGVVFVQFGFCPVFSHKLIEMNGTLAVFNLLPIWVLDGGQLFKAVFASLNEKLDKLFVISGVLICVIGLVFILAPALNMNLFTLLFQLWNNATLIIFLLIFTIGILTKHKRDNREYSKSSQAMNVKQVAFQLGWYFLMVTTCFLILNLSL